MAASLTRLRELASAPRPPETQQRLRAYVWITAFFVASRISYYWAGVRYDTETLAHNFQFIDLELLRTRLLESLFYFHMQPPLQNLIVGVAIKLFPAHYGGALHALYMAAGFSAALMMYELMRRLGVGMGIGVAITILFIVSPGCILFENFPMYEYLILWLLLAASLALYKVVERPTFRWCLTFFSLMAGLSFIRSLYHPVFLLWLAVGLALYLRAHWKMIMTAAIVPLAAVLALFVKNLIVFGAFLSSSWLGFALATCTTHQMTPGERATLIQEGKLSEIADVEAPSYVSQYRRFFPDLKPTGIPVLDEEFKLVGGSLNTNNIIYLKADPLYRQAARQVLRAYPVAYARSVMIAWFCYFLPPTDFFQFDEARVDIREIDRAYNLAIFGQLRETTRKGLRALRAEGATFSLALYTGIFLMVGLPFLLIWSTVHLTKQWRSGAVPKERIALLAFVLLNIVFLMLTTNFLSSFENNRYRFPSDPLYAALLGVFLERAVHRYKHSRTHS